MGEENKNIIEIKELSKRFGSKTILDKISLDIKTGETLVVLGKSGTGKTVLIKCIVGLIIPDSGSLKVLGKDITTINRKELDELRLCLGFLFQGAALYDSMTVKENLEFPLRRHLQKGKGEINDLVLEAIENVGLKEALHKMPSELSGGMRKRIGLARTVILKPKVILYDEPTTGLDPITAHEISELIVQIQEKYKTSSVVITHDIACAKITAERAIMLHKGKVMMEGTFMELLQSDDEWMKEFFVDSLSIAHGLMDGNKENNNYK